MAELGLQPCARAHDCPTTLPLPGVTTSVETAHHQERICDKGRETGEVGGGHGGGTVGTSLSLESHEEQTTNHSISQA